MTEDYKLKWEKCLEILRDNLGEIKTKTWFECAKPIGFNDNKLILSLPSYFFYEKYENEFYNILTLVLKKVFFEGVRLQYIVPIINSDEQSKVSLSGSKQSNAIKNKYVQSTQMHNPLGYVSGSPAQDFDPQLNEALTFENYCVGDSNKLPFTIAEHIANNPVNNIFNPFFLYGDVGVGKTHLIQAIGIRVKEMNPAAKVLFVTQRQFQNLYSDATINKQIPNFLNWFQQIDVLLIDDLQELSHKDGTANALFPIFNHLHQNGKALIFTCDRPPMELDGIMDRLIDRFKWGITEKLPAPDFDLKRKILHFKASKNGLNLSDEIIDLIAANSSGSIRELEGIVMGILTRSITLNVPITTELAKTVMSHTIKTETKKAVNFDMIVEATAEYYKINPDLIFSKNRQRDIADARHVIMYLCHKHTSLSSSAIGHKLNRKHPTVLHGITAIEERLPFAKDIAAAVQTIERELKI